MWEQVIILVVALIVSYALQPKPSQPTPATLEDVDAPTADQGKPIGVAFGDVWINSPNVIWYGDLRTAPIMSDSGKK